MKPREAYVTNRFRRDKQREQLQHAFERYQLRQPQLHSSTLAISEPIGPARPPEPGSLLNITFDSTGLLPAASPDQRSEALSILSPPLLTLEGRTPPDSLLSVPTPASQETLHWAFTHDESKKLKDSTESLGGEIDEFSTVVHPTSTKRQAPSEFSESVNGASRALPNDRRTASIEEELAWNQQSSNSGVLHESEKSCSSMQTLHLPPVQEESETATTSKLTVAEVEDEMKAPRGFIGFIKYGLTKSRLSIQSMVSASGTIRSRFSSRRSSWRSSVPGHLEGLPEDSNPFPYASYLSIPDQPPPSVIQPTPPIDYQGGRRSTSLFFELRLAGATDNEVARRLKILLQDLGLTKAGNLTRIRNNSGETALEVALGLGNLPACRVLLDFGADVYARTSNGKSLSEFGRTAQSQANSNTLYIAIGACRNAILSHSQPRKRGKKAGKPDKGNPVPDGDTRPEENGQPGEEIGGQDYGTAAGTAPSNPHHQGDNDQTQIRPSSSNGSLNPLSAGTYLIGDESGANPTLTPRIASRQSNSVASLPLSQQSATPGVPDLIAFFNSVGAAGLPNQPSRNLRTTANLSPRPSTTLWNSYFDGSQDPSPLTLHFGGPTAPNMLSGARSGFVRSGPRVLETTSYPRSAHYERLPDGRLAYILPVDYQTVPGGNYFPPPTNTAPVPNSQPRNTHRDGRVFGIGSPVELRESMTQMDDFQQIPHLSMFEVPESIPAVDVYASIPNATLYPNDTQQRLCDGSTTSNDFLATLPLPNPFEFPVTRYDSSTNDPTTFNSSDRIPDPQNYQDDLLDLELDTTFSSFALPMPASQPYGNTFVQDWDSWPS